MLVLFSSQVIKLSPNGFLNGSVYPFELIVRVKNSARRKLKSLKDLAEGGRLVPLTGRWLSIMPAGEL